METFSRETSDKLDPWFVTGFVEGDGSFTYHRSGGNVAPVFAIRLTKQDEIILHKIQKFFSGAGRIYQVKPYESPTKGGRKTKSSVYYRVTRYVELMRIVWHFNKYPLAGSKKEAFKIWKEIVLLKEHFRKVPVEELEHLAIELSSLTPRNLPWDGY